MESVNRKISALVKEFIFHSTCLVRNGNLLKSRVSEIRVKRIRINQGVGVLSLLSYANKVFVLYGSLKHIHEL